MKNILFVILVGMAVAVPAHAQQAYEELEAIVKAEVLEASATTEKSIPGTGATGEVQTVVVLIKDGENAGKEVTFENDYVPVEVGDKVFLSHIVDINGSEFYILKDVNRQEYLVLMAVLFVVLLLVFAGWQGFRALLSLLVSVGAILFILVPALMNGYDPALTSLAIAGIILALALFGTHGVNSLSSIAFVGTFLSVAVTCLLAWWFVNVSKLSGFGDDASVFLNFATNGQLDFVGLLLGSIIIGVLGVLDDISITQASVVRELRVANSKFGFIDLYQRALRVGRDHVGSLVNTLALAYVGAALPLVLLFSTSKMGIGFTLNQEVIAAELIRIGIGSIGLILCVPVTTALAAYWFSTRTVEEVAATGHSHSHHHH